MFKNYKSSCKSMLIVCSTKNITYAIVSCLVLSLSTYHPNFALVYVFWLIAGNLIKPCGLIKWVAEECI